MSEEMLAAIICREYGWTWEEYSDQPKAFVDTITDMMHAEGTENERKSKQSAQKRPA